MGWGGAREGVHPLSWGLKGAGRGAWGAVARGAFSPRGRRGARQARRRSCGGGQTPLQPCRMARPTAARGRQRLPARAARARAPGSPRARTRSAPRPCEGGQTVVKRWSTDGQGDGARRTSYTRALCRARRSFSGSMSICARAPRGAHSGGVDGAQRRGAGGVTGRAGCRKGSHRDHAGTGAREGDGVPARAAKGVDDRASRLWGPSSTEGVYSRDMGRSNSREGGEGGGGGAVRPARAW